MFHKNITINGENYPLAVNITGEGAPTEATEGEVGMLYMNTLNGELYKRTADGWVSVLGDIDTALDSIIAIQDKMMREDENV